MLSRLNHHRENASDGTRSEFVILYFSTSDTCLKPCVKAKTCNDSRLNIIHLCLGLSSYLIKPQLASVSDMPKLLWLSLFYPSFSLSFCHLTLLSKNHHLLCSSQKHKQQCKPRMKDGQSQGRQMRKSWKVEKIWETLFELQSCK